eukprot:TRINITY_DN2316_c0_g2_i1.p1 TRINITY_DN2316_c0_g2~~TRINITY_DN2316_c0_g2_i1.p1  ORF type:complete len:706 (+),score=200.91 TRINITY_DN2316_c0_g2_i1:50-2167(+)
MTSPYINVNDNFSDAEWYDILNSAIELSKSKQESKELIQKKLTDMSSFNERQLNYSIKNKILKDEQEREQNLKTFKEQLNTRANQSVDYRIKQITDEFSHSTDLYSQAFEDIIEVVMKRRKEQRDYDVINSVKQFNSISEDVMDKHRQMKEDLAKTRIHEDIKKEESIRLWKSFNATKDDYFKRQQQVIQEQIEYLHDELMRKHKYSIIQAIQLEWVMWSNRDFSIFALIDDTETIENNIKRLESQICEVFQPRMNEILERVWIPRLNIQDELGQLQTSHFRLLYDKFFGNCFREILPEILAQAKILVRNIMEFIENEPNLMYMEERERQLQLELEEEMRNSELVFMKSHDLARSKLIGVTQVNSVSKELQLMNEHEEQRKIALEEEEDMVELEKELMYMEVRKCRQNLVEMEENRLNEMVLMRKEEERRRRVDRLRKKKLQALQLDKQRELNKIREQIRAVESEERKRKQKEEQKAAEEKRLQLQIEYEAKKLRKQKEKQRKQLEEQKYIAEQEQKIKNLLIEGGVFLKHGHRGSPKKRLVWMSNSLDLIQWRDANSSNTQAKGHIFWSDIDEIRKGQTTKIFERQSGEPGREMSCFSLVGRDRTLDLECENPAMMNEWVGAFQWLINQRQRERISRVNEFVKMTQENRRKISSASFPNLKFGRSSQSRLSSLDNLQTNQSVSTFDGKLDIEDVLDTVTVDSET